MDIHALSDPLSQPGSASTLRYLMRMFMDDWTLYLRGESQVKTQPASGLDVGAVVSVGERRRE